MDLKNLTVEQLPVVLTIYEISKIMKVDVKTVLELIELNKIETIKGIEKPIRRFTGKKLQIGDCA